MSRFDSIQDSMFDTVTNLYGDSASWLPANGNPTLTAMVLYKENTDEYDLSNLKFQLHNWHLEYRTPFFSGLKESVDVNTKETVSIVLRGQLFNFYVRRVIAKYDGQTMVAFLSLKTD